MGDLETIGTVLNLHMGAPVLTPLIFAVRIKTKWAIVGLKIFSRE